MRLLFDQNLAAALVPRLADLFPDSAHVRHLGLDESDDALEALLRLHHRDLMVFGEADDAAFLTID